LLFFNKFNRSALDKSEIRFIIGNEDTSKIDLSKEPTFKVSIKYKERQT
jgi:hypothetical protein